MGIMCGIPDLSIKGPAHHSSRSIEILARIPPTSIDKVPLVKITNNFCYFWHNTKFLVISTKLLVIFTEYFLVLRQSTNFSVKSFFYQNYFGLGAKTKLFNSHQIITRAHNTSPGHSHKPSRPPPMAMRDPRSQHKRSSSSSLPMLDRYH